MNGSEFIEVNEESFEEIDDDFEFWLLSSKFSQFNKKDFNLLFGVSVKFSVSSFLNLNVSSNSTSKRFSFANFMNVFQDFNNLWHNNNSFDNLFENLWNFNNLFYSGVDWD